MSSMYSYLMLDWTSFEVQWNEIQCKAPSITWPLEAGPSAGSKSPGLPDISGEPGMKCLSNLACSPRGQGSAFPQNCWITPLQTCMKHIKGSIGCRHRQERQCKAWHRCIHNWLCLLVHHMHKAQSLPLHSLCYLEISLMPSGRRSLLITSPTRVKNTY